ncbi:DUF1801 domain-containing protein [Patescibacteria group bacterium]|nr:DUF1801 domain-containing protein [Patescibacteria group bacterium]MBU1672953.1 DUF1801 domain-containing protein [Patescibacteria group bacterium]
MNKDKKVTAYINKQPNPQKGICQKLRGIIIKTYPDIIEEMKWGAPVYGERYYIGSFKDHVNLGFNMGSLTKKQVALFEGTGKLFRHKKFYTQKDIIEKDIVKLLKLIKKK